MAVMVLSSSNGEGESLNYARMQDELVVEVFTPPAGLTLADCFHAAVAALFREVPDEVTPGSTIDEAGNWTIADRPEPVAPPPPPLPVLTAMQFYLAFTPSERIAIKTSADPMVKEFWDTYGLAVQSNAGVDPNLVSVQESLAYLAQPTTADPPGAGILASPDRVAQILAGSPR